MPAQKKLPSTQQELASKFCLLGISCLISLCILELGARIYLCGFDSLWPPIINSIHDLGTAGVLQPSNNPEIIYELKPNLNVLFKKAKLRTNSAGLSDKEYPKEKSNNSFRVAVLGDSYSMPTGASHENAYHSILEERLSRNFQDKQIEFINFAVGGYQLRQSVGVLRYKAASYRPDLILIGFFLGSIPNPLAEDVFKKKYVPNRKTWPFFTLHCIRMIRQALNAHTKTANSRDTLTPNKMAYVDDEFKEIEILAKSHGFRVLVIGLRTKTSDPDISSFVKTVSQKHNFWFLDLTHPFKEKDSRQFMITREDGHPNIKAHQLFADQIYPFLKNVINEYFQKNQRVPNEPPAVIFP